MTEFTELPDYLLEPDDTDVKIGQCSQCDCDLYSGAELWLFQPDELILFCSKSCGKEWFAERYLKELV